ARQVALVARGAHHRVRPGADAPLAGIVPGAGVAGGARRRVVDVNAGGRGRARVLARVVGARVVVAAVGVRLAGAHVRAADARSPGTGVRAGAGVAVVARRRVVDVNA